MSRCPSGVCKADINAMVARKIAVQAVEAAIKSALATVASDLEIALTRKGSDARQIFLDAVAEGLIAANPFLDAIHKE